MNPEQEMGNAWQAYQSSNKSSEAYTKFRSIYNRNKAIIDSFNQIPGQGAKVISFAPEPQQQQPYSRYNVTTLNFGQPQQQQQPYGQGPTRFDVSFAPRKQQQQPQYYGQGPTPTRFDVSFAQNHTRGPWYGGRRNRSRRNKRRSTRRRSRKH